MDTSEVRPVTTDGRSMASIDTSDDPSTRVNYLDYATKVAAAYKRETFELLDLKPGDAVLDVGCGTGDDVRAMAAIVGSSGRAVGLDLSRAMIEEAERRSETLDLPGEFVQGSAYDLPFDDDTFDAARIDRVLQHLDDPVTAMREMARVTRPGGRVLAVDTDFGSLIVTNSHPELARRIWSWWEAWRAEQPGSSARGRYLYEHFLDAGLVDLDLVTTSPAGTDIDVADNLFGVIRTAHRASDAGAITVEEADEWERDLRDRAARGRFLASFIGFRVVGRVPDAVET